MTMASESKDLVILGGGPGGYIAGIRAGQLGLKTVLVEADRLGGICLNWGCIPTKALLKNAEVYRQFQEASTWGIQVDGLRLDFPKVIKRSRDVSDRLSKGVGGLLKKYGCEVISGRGRLGPRQGDRLTVEIEGPDGGKRSLQTARVCLATG